MTDEDSVRHLIEKQQEVDSDATASIHDVMCTGLPKSPTAAMRSPFMAKSTCLAALPVPS
jgi:hypothetical protein